MVAYHIDNKNGQSGSAVVMVVMFLTILMLAGLMSSSTATTDISIARNTVISTQNSVAAESAAMAGIQVFENEVDADKLQPAYNSGDWINADPNNPDATVADKAEKWAYQVVDMTRYRRDGLSPRYRAIGWSTTPGSSIGQYAPSLKECRVIGEYNSDLYGIYRVELGYKKRF